MHVGDHPTQLRKHFSEYFQLTFTANYLVESKTDHLSL
ncbi:hypothetical protein CPLU01_15779 [Colletotrichum plurivorum]|uniref:Uncharacterized protein n=1 Tax=Colletotrichum plurivorum TaxID=2175906 RepID=A0A8H6MSP2_9PEZI|nr:hypothetical protein CPLU01_15779 [Colletotrichum plurivorum]